MGSVVGSTGLGVVRVGTVLCQWVVRVVLYQRWCVVMGALCRGAVRVQYTKPVGSALVPYQGREVPICRAQDPTITAILRDYRLYHRLHKISYLKTL